MPCEQLKQALEKGATLIDVRTPLEFASGSINGARNYPLTQLPTVVAELPKDKPVLLYCRSGARSGSAQQFLAQAGFEAYNIGSFSTFEHCG